MTTISGSAGGSRPPPGSGNGQDPRKGTGQQVTKVKIPKSGKGNFRQLPMWTLDLQRNPQELPGYVVRTHGATAALWQQVTPWEACSWAQIGAEIYNGVTLEVIDSSETPASNMINPGPPPATGDVATAVNQQIIDTERALDEGNDANYIEVMAYRKLFLPSSTRVLG
jgi:hypothetical protein